MNTPVITAAPHFVPTGRRLVFETLPSTNTWALEHLNELGHGDVVWARRQTGGRGRLGRMWSAMAEGGLTCSLVLRDPSLTPIAANLGQMMACAVLDSLRSFGIAGMVKWPNDVMVDDGKMAGVLVEQGQVCGDYVVGVGINVNLTEGDLKGFGLDRPAASMCAVAGRCYDVEAVLTDLLTRFSDWMDKVRRDGLDLLWAAWSKHDWLAARSIRVLGVEGAVEGVYLGVDELGRLRLRLGSGVEERYWTGDVERVKIQR
jgi:BirA family biotin operon repressor/biotin-[acetyl-CoA-carboxylase] ligase